jgi:hypothetical protein
MLGWAIPVNNSLATTHWSLVFAAGMGLFSMSNAEKKVVIGALFVFVLMGLFPPWMRERVQDNTHGYGTATAPTVLVVFQDSGGYSLIFLAPSEHGGHRIDLPRLIVQWFVVAGLAAACILILRVRFKSDAMAQERG